MTKEPIAGTPKVVFSIPLISRENARNWPQVCANLRATINVLRKQNNPNWSAVICSQSKPDGIAFDDQVQFLPFEEAVIGNDRPPKRRAIAALCQRSNVGDVYIFHLDADDYVHPDLVDYMFKTRDPSGYLVDRGYMYDIASGKLAPLQFADPTDVQKQEGPFGLGVLPYRLDAALRRLTGKGLPNLPPRLSKMTSFDSRCGSCVAWRFRCNGQEPDPCVLPDIRHRHIRLANDEGLMQLNPVPFNAMIYVIGHGENIQEAKGRLHFKTRYIDQFNLPEQERQRVLTTFGAG